MAARNPFKGRTEAARAFLESVGISTAKMSKPGYVERVAGQVQRQIEAGLAPSRQAARGHATTKEHANRKAAPQLAAYKQTTRPVRARQPRVTKPLVGPILRDHERPPSIPENVGKLSNVLDVAVAHTGTTPASASSFLYAVLRRAEEHPEEHWRVVLSGYDCELRMWAEAFYNTKRSPGASIRWVLDNWREAKDQGTSFYEWMLATINENGSPTIVTLKHLCLFQVFAYRNYIPAKKAG